MPALTSARPDPRFCLTAEYVPYKNKQEPPASSHLPARQTTQQPEDSLYIPTVHPEDTFLLKQQLPLDIIWHNAWPLDGSMLFCRRNRRLKTPCSHAYTADPAILQHESDNLSLFPFLQFVLHHTHLDLFRCDRQ